MRGALVSLDDACREILGQHPYPPALRRALAELLAAAALLASTLKFKGTLDRPAAGRGPGAAARRRMRRGAQPARDRAVERRRRALPADAPLSVLAGDPARSRLAITLDPKDGGPLYQGIVALEASSIAALIEHYLTTSEQIDSRMVLAADGARVRGLLLQRLPSAGPDDDATWQRAVAAGRHGSTPPTLLGAAAAERAARRALPRRRHPPVRAARRCASAAAAREERVANALRMLGPRRSREHPRRAGHGRRDLRVLQSQLPFVADDARALFAQPGCRRRTAAGRGSPLADRRSGEQPMSLYVPGHFAARDRDDLRAARPRPSVRDAGDAGRARAARHAPAADPRRRPRAARHAARSLRARQSARARSSAAESIAIFHGPHAYVSPSWYADPAAAVPTWNYAVAHAHGTIELAQDAAETRAILDLLIQRFEARARGALAARARPRPRLRAMVDAIVGFRIRVKRIDVKFKLSQNRSARGPRARGGGPRRRRLRRRRSRRRRGCGRCDGRSDDRRRRRDRRPSQQSRKRGEVEEQVRILVAAPDRIREQRGEDQTDRVPHRARDAAALAARRRESSVRRRLPRGEITPAPACPATCRPSRRAAAAVAASAASAATARSCRARASSP